MKISGKMLRDAIVSGANNIVNNKNMVDELNVFPVPDGDTGTNMSMTIRNALPELKAMKDSVTVGAVAEATASAMLRGARGNSGVILSLLFRGLAKGLSGKTEADGVDIAKALGMGVEAAYKSVMKPTEGTILTVARESAEAASKMAVETADAKEIFKVITETAKVSLDNTPNLLDTLAKAGVVDAGGMGFLVIMEGMRQVVEGKPGVEAESSEAEAVKHPVITNAAGSVEADIEFTYCTEFLVQKKPDCRDANLLRAYLETIGDCVVVVDDDEIIKVHVHTEHPGKALEEGLLFGPLINLKIENMKEQHKTQEKKVEMAKKRKAQPVKPEKEFGFVSVVNGAGLEAIFTDLGVDGIVRGGQTSNPSTEDIAEAIMATPAENVFVLPNNKNVIMAAEQAARLIKDRNVIVLQSRTVPQGISAMIAFDSESSVAENSVNMTAALDNVGTGSVTFAVRDSDFDGKKIKQGDILAMENGKLALVERDVTKALIKITKRLIKSDSSYITVIYGADVTDDSAEEAYKVLKSKLGDDLEVVLVNGGQPIYYYIVSVE